jgi:hypothetical protein
LAPIRAVIEPGAGARDEDPVDSRREPASVSMRSRNSSTFSA